MTTGQKASKTIAIIGGGVSGTLTAFHLVRHEAPMKISHSMLSIASEAEDIVQDVWLFWQPAARSVVRDATPAKSLLVDKARSARQMLRAMKKGVIH